MGEGEPGDDLFSIARNRTHWAAILTAVVAGSAYGWYRYERWQKRGRLENYLRAKKKAGGAKSKRTVLHLGAELGMTKAEVVDAAFRSSCIERRVSVDQKGHASKILLEYSSK